MNQDQFTKLVDDTFTDCRNLLVVKGGEYAGSDDRLANFKRGAALTGCTPEQVLLVYLSKHYDSYCTYVKTKAAGNVRASSEPITGRLDDLINYCLLAKALFCEAGDANAKAHATEKICLRYEEGKPEQEILAEKVFCDEWLRTVRAESRPTSIYYRGRLVNAWRYISENIWRAL